MADEKDKKSKGGGGDPGGAKVPKEKKVASKDKGKKVEAGPVPTYKRTGVPRVQAFYHKDVVPALMKEFNYTNPMQVPRLVKVTLNMGLGEAVANPKILETAVEDLRAIAGQSPVTTRSKKAIANFKLREGLKIGAMVTLRRANMWEFLDRFMNFALARVRDFKGVSPKGFDGRGNYSVGIKEHIIFPEINVEKIDKIKGMNITIVTTANTDEEGRALLRLLGMPFKQPEKRE
jgi:large subunit ribosomal protein L5